MMRLRGKGLTEEEQKDSGGEQKDEDEGLGPRSNVSLLDQHQHLKEKAEGLCPLHHSVYIMYNMFFCLVFSDWCSSHGASVVDSSL